MLGKLEEEVLLATLQAGPSALPSEIFASLEEARSSRGSPAFGAVYTTLSRMAVKGLLQETPKVDANGRKRRAFSVSAEGRSALRGSMDTISRLGGFSLAGGSYA